MCDSCLNLVTLFWKKLSMKVIICLTVIIQKNVSISQMIKAWIPAFLSFRYKKKIHLINAFTSETQVYRESSGCDSFSGWEVFFLQLFWQTLKTDVMWEVQTNCWSRIFLFQIKLNQMKEMLEHTRMHPEITQTACWTSCRFTSRFKTMDALLSFGLFQARDQKLRVHSFWDNMQRTH